VGSPRELFPASGSRRDVAATRCPLPDTEIATRIWTILLTAPAGRKNVLLDTPSTGCYTRPTTQRSRFRRPPRALRRPGVRLDNVPLILNIRRCTRSRPTPAYPMSRQRPRYVRFAGPMARTLRRLCARQMCSTQPATTTCLGKVAPAGPRATAGRHQPARGKKYEASGGADSGCAAGRAGAPRRSRFACTWQCS
jgi:hypothetical protein